MSRRRSIGFTLIEMMIVLLILGVIAAIAVPSYRDYVLRANRADAKAALLALATAQEKYYLQCNTYTPTLTAGTANTCPTGTGTTGSSLNYSATSERGYYTLAVTAADANGWTATAVPVASTSPQLKDSKCQFFSLNSVGVRGAGPTSTVTAATTEECWGR
jgi:type IV pilus assembly protein PilE